MDKHLAAQLDFEDPRPVERGEAEPAFIVDVEGFAGPLDLLLELARRQKVDLAKISVLALVDQYLAFIEEARRFRLELAADYLVMAAWLAYLKSRLLLPEPPKGEEPSAEELASVLAFRLQRLEAIRAAAKLLAERPRLGRDIFARGMPEPVVVRTTPDWDASLHDLLAAYAAERQKHALARVTLRQRPVWTLAEAREALHRLIGVAVEWTVLDDFLTQYVVEPSMRRTVRASAFVATLEMVREGLLDVQQDRAFASIWVKSKAA
jgi:segregation and condensation protein A